MGNKLYVGNLSWTTTEESLTAAFAQAGSVTSAQIPLNHMGKSRGFGFVEMGTPEEAQAAIDLFNEKDLDGRTIDERPLLDALAVDQHPVGGTEVVHGDARRPAEVLGLLDPDLDVLARDPGVVDAQVGVVAPSDHDPGRAERQLLPVELQGRRRASYLGVGRVPTGHARARDRLAAHPEDP